MSDLILHHYALSPFSEKIRALLGYSGVPWRSAITREMPPRPVLAALAGGYRKIPVAQIGADVFCDSRLIAREIARLADRPALDPAQAPPGADELAARAESRMFFACIMASGSFKLVGTAARSMRLRDMAGFIRDRVAVGRSARVPVIKPREAPAAVRAWASELEDELTVDFLYGPDPVAADFSVYLGLWFIRELAGKRLLDPYTRLSAWMDRMRDFGHGTPEKIDGEGCLEAARQATPRALEDAWLEDSAVGRPVTIAPIDYARDPARGTLVAVAPDRWIIARESAGTGTVHVHLPRQGYALDPE